MFIFVKLKKIPRHVFFSGSFNNVHYYIITSIRICCLTCIYFFMKLRRIDFILYLLYNVIVLFENSCEFSF